ncbi:MAG: excinuclease ABC subunit C [Bdellovibrionales bacterium GWB1_52_6]|nr:MAG: excinuclease ABC subunit C [Bdellovibrionales bacterium GWB1_52_6]OFZ06060.1 MAG: excinuclease ABC subunit C [Bdellovibrionales bacterium GWA1_52_35]HCM39315.1 excinuclease ABC subunit C [Bdellovibrionales bacterium]
MENQASKPLIRNSRAVLLEQARAVRSSPGVYLMKNEKGEILYVGKAKVLPNRVSSYFQAGPHENPRTEMLVGRIQYFDVILTETEAEALILEATLIKKHKPKFNVRLKDDKAYPYLKIQLNEPYPRIVWTRRVLRDEARYFGPFPSAWAARQVMELLNETFRLRTCSENTFRHRSRPCILFQMGKCTAPCVHDAQDYHEQVEAAVRVLEGKSDQLIAELTRGMQAAAEREEFEIAAEYRDQIRNVSIVTETQGAVEAGAQRDRDVIGIVRKDMEAHGTLLRIRGGRLISIQHYHFQNTDPSMPDAELLFDFLAQHYLSPSATTAATGQPEEHVRKEERDPPASEVLLPQAPDDHDLLERVLGVHVRTAETLIDEQLLNVARANAEYAMEQSQKKTQGHGVQALEAVQEKLHLQNLPCRIECYDISNIQGEDAVASRVVFINGAPDKTLYRRYKIKTVKGANDFAMMKEILGRRFSHAEEALPDLVVVDGGKGQLSQAVAILDELQVQGVAAVGLAKARTESDFKATEVKSSHERIFIPNRKNPIPLLPHTDAYKLLVHVRDEAHRFAVSYHRVVRSKRTFKSG